MARKRKKRATASCEGEGEGCSESKSLIDRLSDLPDQLTHHILSFLDITDVARVCCVSKRLRALSLSAPSFNFDEISMSCRSTCYNRRQLMDYVERFLFRLFHFRDHKLQSFRVNWTRHYAYENETVCTCSIERYEIFTWIYRVVRYNVEALELKMTLNDPEEVPFPYSVFLCESLKSLVVDMDFTILQTPSFGFSSSLTKLELKNVVIEDEQFFKWITCSCKVIQELYLYQVRGIDSISIESSSLRKFRIFDEFNTSHLGISGDKLEFITVHWYVVSPGNSSLNICAPSLKQLLLSGMVMSHLSLGNFRCLQSGVLNLKADADKPDTVCEVVCNKFNIGDLTMGVAVKAPFSKGSMDASISDIHFMTMNIVSLTDELVPAIVSLFRGLPSIYKLNISYQRPSEESQSYISGFDVRYWKLQNLAFIDKLKMVTIEVRNESNVINLARYILECAQNLLKMTVIYPPQDSETVLKKLKESKIVSGATVVYREK